MSWLKRRNFRNERPFHYLKHFFQQHLIFSIVFILFKYLLRRNFAISRTIMHMTESSWPLVIDSGFDGHDSFDKMEILVGSHVLKSKVFRVVDAIVRG